MKQQIKQEKQRVHQNPIQRTIKPQMSPRVSHNLYLQTQGIIGNHGLLNRCGSDAIQAKLALDSPNDRYEQEAERVADAVMRMPEPRVQRQPEEKEEESLQAKEPPGHSEVAPNLETFITAIRRGGQPLSESVRAFFEPRFGYDFSKVRVHTDAGAADIAGTVDAQAFTSRRDIVFGARQYAPETTAGKRVLAHELMHVLQQSGVNARGKLTNGQPDDVYDHDADKGEDKMNINGKDSASFIQTNSQVFTGDPIIQRRQRRIHFVSDRPREDESTATVEAGYLNEELTTRAYLAETRGMSAGRNVRLTGRASREAPRSLSNDEQRAYNSRLSNRRAIAVQNYLRDIENPPTIMDLRYLGDVGAESNIPTWRRVDVDIEEDEVTGRPAEEGEEVWEIDSMVYPTGVMSYQEDTDWGYGQILGAEDDSSVSFSASIELTRTGTGFANATFDLSVTDFRDEIDNDTHSSIFRGNIGFRARDGNLILDDEMSIERQSVSIAGDLVVRVGLRSVGTNEWQLLIHVIYVNKKQQPDGGGGISVSVVGSGGGLTAPSGIRGGGSVAHTFECADLRIAFGLYD
jgi:hypothetical protein